MNGHDFSGVQDTLFIPLAARVFISERFPEYFYDPVSMKFKDLEQIKKINAKSSEYSAIASVARYYNMDAFVSDFIERHSSVNIINLGAGLDTMNYRIKNEKAHFFSVDFESVTGLREKILGRSENETIIGSDIRDLRWAEDIDVSKPSMLIASGVFQYFKPEDVSSFIKDLRSVFKNAELVFDATNEVGIKYAQKYVKKSGNKDAMMYFYINDAKRFADENNVGLIEVRGFFDEARKMIGKKMGLYARIAMKVADEKKRTLLLHIDLA